MSRNRTAAILVACTALLCPYSASAAAPSRLEPTPPVALPRQAPPPPTGGQRWAGEPGRSHQSTNTQRPRDPAARTTIRTSAGKTTAIPRTGTDLALQVLLAAGLLVLGATLRTRLAWARAGER